MMRPNWNVHIADSRCRPAAWPMPAQAAPHMTMQWGPPTSPMSKAVAASDVVRLYARVRRVDGVMTVL